MINILSIFPIIVGVYLNLFSNFSLILVLIIPYAFYYLKKTESNEISYSHPYDIFAEGEYPLIFVFILLGKLLL